MRLFYIIQKGKRRIVFDYTLGKSVTLSLTDFLGTYEYWGTPIILSFAEPWNCKNKESLQFIPKVQFFIL